MKKDWIEEAYRSWFNRLDEEVPEEVWTGIADELDVDEVWDKVSEELDRSGTRAFSPWITRAAAVLLLLFSALAAYWYLSPSPNHLKAPLAGRPPAGNSGEPSGAGRETPGAERRPAAAIPSPEQPSSAEAADDKNPTRKPPVGNDGPADRNNGVQALASNAGNGSQPLDAALTAQARLTGKTEGGMPPPQPVQLLQAEHTRQTAQADLPELPEPEAPADLLAGVSAGPAPEASGGGKSPFIRLQRIGMVSAYSNTWMLNHETFSGLRPSTLTATTFTYGSGVGLNAAFLVNGKHRIGAELYLSSPAGQGYRQYIEARYQRRSIELDYSKMQLYYQLPVFSGKGDVLAGAYVSYLKRGREKIAGEARTVARFYRDIDYGIMAGYQFNLPVNERLLLQPGIRVNYGLPNIFRGNQHIPGNFLRTHNAAAGLYLGVSYRLY